jgi:hypothetical protein
MAEEKETIQKHTEFIKKIGVCPTCGNKLIKGKLNV